MSRVDLGYVAELQDESRLIKVGRTRNVKQRISTIRQASPFDVRLIAVFARGAEGERELIGAMDGYRQKGEWFRPNDALTMVLRRWLKEGRMLRQVPTNDDYATRVIVPALKKFLNGRECCHNNPGDLAYRILNGGVPDSIIMQRAHELIDATDESITHEMILGYVPIEPDSNVADLFAKSPAKPRQKVANG